MVDWQTLPEHHTLYFILYTSDAAREPHPLSFILCTLYFIFQTLPEHHIRSTIDMSLYFIPDLPLDVVLDAKPSSEAKTLMTTYQQQLTYWC